MKFEDMMMERGLDPYGSEELGEFIDRCLFECGGLLIPGSDIADTRKQFGLRCVDPMKIN